MDSSQYTIPNRIMDHGYSYEIRILQEIRKNNWSSIGLYIKKYFDRGENKIDWCRNKLLRKKLARLNPHFNPSLDFPIFHFL